MCTVIFLDFFEGTSCRLILILIICVVVVVVLFVYSSSTPIIALLCLEAKQVLMLLVIKLEFEYFEPIFVNSNNIYALVLIHFRLQLKLGDKVRDHFEVQDSYGKVNHVPERIYVSLFLRMVLIVEEREQAECNHQYLQDKQNRSIANVQVTRIGLGYLGRLKLPDRTSEQASTD